MSQSVIEKVHDILEIQTLKAKYCVTVDALLKEGEGAGAAARLKDLFVEDVKGDYGTGPLEGSKAIQDFLVNELGAAATWVMHSIHTPLIEVSGDTAKGSWTLGVGAKLKGAAEAMALDGRYTDEFRRTPQGWRISAIQFRQEG